MPVTEGSYEIKNFNCNGTINEFDFDWPVFGEEDLVVKVYDGDGNETLLALTTGYTVAKAGNDWKDGGAVTTIETYASGYTLSLERAVARKQPADYITGDSFPAETHEKVLNRAIMIIQELQNLVDRSIKAPADDPDTIEMTLPTKTKRADRYVYFDADGKPTAAGQSLLGGITVTAFGETFLDDADAEAVCDTIGALDVNNDTLDDVTEGTTYKRLADANASNHPTRIDDAAQFENAQTRYLNLSLVGWSYNVTNVQFLGHSIELRETAIYGTIKVNLPHGATVTAMYSIVSILGHTYVKVKLHRSSITTNTNDNMAYNEHTGVGAINDDSIFYPVIDNENYQYYVHVLGGDYTSYSEITGIRITYTITEPKP